MRQVDSFMQLTTFHFMDGCQWRSGEVGDGALDVDRDVYRGWVQHPLASSTPSSFAAWYGVAVALHRTLLL